MSPCKAEESLELYLYSEVCSHQDIAEWQPENLKYSMSFNLHTVMEMKSSEKVT
jgi:hypothetical protein